MSAENRSNRQPDAFQAGEGTFGGRVPRTASRSLEASARVGTDLQSASDRSIESRRMTRLEIPGSIEPPVRALLGPGPSDVHPSVLRALAKGTIGHLDPYYLAIMDEMQDMLRRVFRTENRMTLAISGTGSAGQEATIVNLVEPGDRVVVCVAGVFGARLAEMAERAGGAVTRVERPWGEIFEPNDLESTLVAVKPKLVAIVLAETSTGAWQPIEAISEQVHAHGGLLVVDAVTALGGVPVEVDRWQIDAVYAGTQKCLSCPPGLAPVSFSPRAVACIESRKRKVASWYFDISLLSAYWGQQRTYHHTAPVNMTYALHEALRRVLDEGLEAGFARHRLHHAALGAGLAAMNIDYVGQEGHRLPQLNAVRVPEGVSEPLVRRQLLDRFGIEIGAGLGAFQGRVWRIGLMGYSSRTENVLLLLSALDQLLAEQCHAFPRGAGVAAANDWYRQHQADATA